MARLQLMDSMYDIIVKMSDGNPGAISFIMELKVQYNNDAQWVQALLAFDMMELYGSQLYMLWNDSCDRDCTKVIKIVEAYKRGKITNTDIDERIKNVGYGQKFDDLLEVK